MSLSIPITPNSLSSAARSLSIKTKLSQLSLTISIPKTYKTTSIQMGGLRRPRRGGEERGMGGGPPPYPGGEALLEWKRMQGKKSKEVLKARLDRENQIYKMRKRAEIKAAVPELERPWETLEKPLNLFRPDNSLPSQEGAFHSGESYWEMDELTNPSEEFESSGKVGKIGLRGNRYGRNSRSNRSGLNNGRNVNNLARRSSNGVEKEGQNQKLKGKLRKKGSTRTYSEGKNLGNARFYNRFDARSRRPGDSSREFRTGNSFKKEVLDMSLHNDGSYGFESGNTGDAVNSTYLGR